MQGYYHSSETFGTVDGPGIRYVLFLSGCSMRCTFCHNPDTWACGGKEITPEKVMGHIAKFRRYYSASGGGMTVSGGEPLLQTDFVAELFKRCRDEGVHTLLDTGGYSPSDNLKGILPYTDMVSFSIKAVQKDKHLKLTGVDNRLIIDNLHYVSGQKPTVLRYVVIPGVNDTASDLTELASLVKSLPGEVPVELLPYHSHGAKKWDALGMEYILRDVKPANEGDVERVRRLLADQNMRILDDDAKQRPA